jgi:hypothetical protein
MGAEFVVPFSSRSLALKSSTFLSENIIIRKKTIAIFHSNDDLFTQYLI